MTKIEEILEKYKTKTDYYADQEWQDSDVEKALIEYATWYAKKVLELAAENAVTSYGYSCIIDKESITNIQLPPHE